jgi:membrane protein implicated in regulation of membrane protease activity
MRFAGMALLFVGLSSLALAGVHVVPEVSPTSGVAALAVVSGALLVVRGRRKK